MRSGKIAVALTAFLIAACVRIQTQTPFEQSQHALQAAIDHCHDLMGIWKSTQLELRSDSVIASGRCFHVFTREDFETQSAKLANAVRKDSDDHYTVTTGDNAFRYYFTKPNHKMYPLAVLMEHSRTNFIPIDVAVPKYSDTPRTADAVAAFWVWASDITEEFRVDVQGPPTPPH